MIYYSDLYVKVYENELRVLEATRIGKLLHGDHFELIKLRLLGRQMYRSNPPSSTTEEYYRITLCDEFLSHVVYELEERSVNNSSHITLSLHLIPSVSSWEKM